MGPNADFAVKVPDDLGLDVACMFGCSTLTSYTAIENIKSTVELFCKMNGKLEKKTHCMYPHLDVPRCQLFKVWVRFPLLTI